MERTEGISGGAGPSNGGCPPGRRATCARAQRRSSGNNRIIHLSVRDRRERVQGNEEGRGAGQGTTGTGDDDSHRDQHCGEDLDTDRGSHPSHAYNHADQPGDAVSRQRVVFQEEVGGDLPVGQQSRGHGNGASRENDRGTQQDVVFVETTQGWTRNMPDGMDSDDEGVDVDLTGSQAEDEIQILSSNVTRSMPTVRKRRREDNVRVGETTTEALVLRMLRQQQAAAAQLAAQPPEVPSRNPTCGICFEAMGKNTDRQMAAGNCGHVYCKPCLTHSVKGRKKCPMCSAKLTVKQIRNIFFEM